MDDHTLKRHLEALRQGDAGALEAIYEGLKVPVYTIALRMLYRVTEAEDVVQETFLRLYRDPPGPEVTHPRAWIFRIARNLAIDALRAGDRTLPLTADTADTARSLAASVGMKADVEAALAGLEPGDRELVTLHLNGGLKFRELAGLTGRPLGTVLWRYRRALSRLRAYLNGGEL